MRQFACAEDIDKVRTISRHDPFLVTGRKSIANIGYEDELHTISCNAEVLSVESSINNLIETPFTRTTTWKKIVDNNPHALDVSDKLNLYLFARHLQFRNVENLHFLEQEAQQIKNAGMPEDYSQDERESRDFILNSLSGPKGFFLQMASGLSQFMGRWREASIAILTSKTPLRTSTNPVLTIPRTLGDMNLYDFLEPDAFVYWLPLAPHFGLHLTLTKRFCDFKHYELEDNMAHMLNRMYLVQLNSSLSVRHCLADDPYIQRDLTWANYSFFDGRNEKMRFKRMV